MDPVISVRSLTKQFHNREVLHQLTFDVPQGSITAVLGPNGAGKTTCLRILTTTLMPTSGDVHVLGHDVITHPALVRRQIAVAPQDSLPDTDLTGWEAVFGYLLARGVPSKHAKAQAEESLRDVGLWEDRNRLVGAFSGGMKRRTIIAMALASRARVIFLDEPTSGLDPSAKRDVWSLLHRIKGASTVVLSTHLMDEVEAIADYVVLLEQGEILAQGSVNELRARIPAREKVLVSKTVPLDLIAGSGRIIDNGGQWAVFLHQPHLLHGLIEKVRPYGSEVTLQPVGLEDAYLILLGKMVTAESQSLGRREEERA